MYNAVMNTASTFIESFLRVEEEMRILTVLSKGGLFLAREGAKNSFDDKYTIEGGLLASITMFIEKMFDSELSEVKLRSYKIFIRHSKHFMTYLVVNDALDDDFIEIQDLLGQLLEFLEIRCPEARRNFYQTNKIQLLVQQFSTNFFLSKKKSQKIIHKTI